MSQKNPNRSHGELQIGEIATYTATFRLTKKKSKALIDRKFGQVANQLNKDVKLLIEGYSEIGTPMTRRYNTQLSRNRAYLVSEYLIEKYGFKNTNLAIKGFGPDNPISTDRSEDGQRLNRRVEIYLVK